MCDFITVQHYPRLQNALWDVLLTPEGSDRVPTHPRVLHDMIALLQENKIRKREVSISTYTIRYDQPQTSFSRAPPPREVYRISPGQLLCQTLLTRAQGNHLGTLDGKHPSQNVLCENGNKNKSEGDILVLLVLPFSHRTFLEGCFSSRVPKWFL